MVTPRESRLRTLDPADNSTRTVLLPPGAVVEIGDWMLHIPAGQTKAVLNPGHAYRLVDWDRPPARRRRRWVITWIWRRVATR